MSDQTPPPDGTNPPSDQITNLKAEMNRKLSNMEAAQAQLLSAIQTLQKPAPAATPAGKRASEIIFDDTDKAVEMIAADVDARVSKKFDEQNKAQARFNAAASELMSEYPEAGDTSSELRKLADEVYKGFDESERGSPIAMRAAVAQAASTLGLKPKSKRGASAEQEGFTLGSTSGSHKPAPRDKGSELDPNTEALAAFFPQYIKLDDKATRERLATKHGRKTYSKWGN